MRAPHAQLQGSEPRKEVALRWVATEFSPTLTPAGFAWWEGYSDLNTDLTYRLASTDLTYRLASAVSPYEGILGHVRYSYGWQNDQENSPGSTGWSFPMPAMKALLKHWGFE